MAIIHGWMHNTRAPNAPEHAVQGWDAKGVPVMVCGLAGFAHDSELTTSPARGQSHRCPECMRCIRDQVVARMVQRTADGFRTEHDVAAFFVSLMPTLAESTPAAYVRAIHEVTPR